MWKTDQMGLAGGKQAVLGGLEVSREEVMVMGTRVVTAGMESKYRMRKSQGWLPDFCLGQLGG